MLYGATDIRIVHDAKIPLEVVDALVAHIQTLPGVAGVAVAWQNEELDEFDESILESAKSRKDNPDLKRQLMRR